LDNSFEHRGAKIVIVEQTPCQAASPLANDDAARLRECLETSGDVGRVSNGCFRDRRVSSPSLTDHDQAGVDSDASAKRYGRAKTRNCLCDFQPRTDGTRGIVLVGLRPAEIDHQSIAQILSDVTLVALDDLSCSLLIDTHYIA